MDHPRDSQLKTKDRSQPVVSAVLADGTLVETLYRRDERRTLFCVAKDGEIRYESSITDEAERLVPYSAGNDLLTKRIVLLPSEPEEYGSEQELVQAVQAYIHRYVDVSPLFEKIATYYVLFSWVYDAFRALPYLRLRGDYGTGKSRFLMVVGATCYKPIFASGASTVSPLFRMIDEFRGTLILDEGDFRSSNEQSEIVKILNNGNGDGFGVLRSEPVNTKEFKPKAYVVYGPKVIASRGFFEDRALESRCLTEETGSRPLRDDIPITLPAIQEEEALRLRNKLLLFRLRKRSAYRAGEELVDRVIEPRLSQVFVPLLSVIEDEEGREELRSLARQYHAGLIADRGQTMEAQVLQIIHDHIASQPTRPSVKEITSWFTDKHGEEYPEKITPRWIGGIMRKKLQLTTQKSNGVFVVPPSEEPKLQRLYAKYGITEPGTGTSGMLGTSGTSSGDTGEGAPQENSPLF